MKYKIDKGSKTPAYLQLYIQIRKDIVDGTYKSGAKLPSKRLLAEEARVSVITAEHAYAILADEGYIEAREKSGYFVIYNSEDLVSVSDSLPKKHDTQSKLHSHRSSFPFSVLAKTMRKVLLDYGDEILIKSPNKGCPELREAICAYLSRSVAISVKPEQIVIGSGAEYLYSLIIQLFGADKTYAIEDPSYETIYRVYKAGGVKCERLRLGSNGIDSTVLEQSKARILHVTPFNSYPSHVSADVSKRSEYIKWAAKRKGYIVEDNYDSELTVSRKNEDTLFSMCESSRVVYLNTFSRTIAPSIRVGYMVLPESLLERFEKRLGFYSCTVPVYEQYVLAELINSGDFERHINRVRRAKRKIIQENS